MTRVREVIIVEGRYDKHAVLQAVDATVIETGGFQILADGEKLALVKRLAEARGLVILTDSDGAGFLIRGKLKSALAGLNVRHAYIPDVPGREKRKTAPSKSGLLGVEGMGAEVILDALKRSGATFEDAAAPVSPGDPITKADLYELGLSGTWDAANRREKLLTRLGLPRLLKANGLLAVLNCLYSREAFFALAAEK